MTDADGISQPELDKFQAVSLPGTSRNLLADAVNLQNTGSSFAQDSMRKSVQTIDSNKDIESLGKKSENVNRVTDRESRMRTSVMTGSSSQMQKKQLMQQKTRKSEQLLAESNFHQLRQHQKQEAKAKAKEEMKRQIKVQRSMNQDALLESLGEQNEDTTEIDVSSPMLRQIMENDEDEDVVPQDLDKYIRRTGDGKSIQLISPGMQVSVQIRNPKITIASDPLRFEELKHIEDTMNGMSTMPDFGYGDDNFVIERSSDAPRNWKLLTDFVYNKDKYEWLQNHLTLRKIRQKQSEEDEKKRAHLITKKIQQVKDPNESDKKAKFVITAKEMATLEELKKTLAQQANFLQKFKMMGSTQQRNKKFAFGQTSPALDTHNLSARRSLIDRQKEYVGVKKSRASMSPDQLRQLELRSSKQSLNFGVSTSIGANTTPFTNQISSNTLQESSLMFREDLNERERQILGFCEQQQDKLTRALNKTYKDGKQIQRLDETQKRLKKLMPAKLALAQIIRAIKKRDYMILNSDQVPEIDQIKPVVPEITQFAEDIREMRAIQRSLFSMQFKRESPDEERQNIFTLPQLSSRGGRNGPGQSTMQTLESHKNSRLMQADSASLEASPVRYSLEAGKAKDYEEMKKEMMLMNGKRGNSINLQSAKQVNLSNQLYGQKKQTYQQRMSQDQMANNTNKFNKQNINGQSSTDLKEVQSPEIHMFSPLEGQITSPYMKQAMIPPKPMNSVAANLRLNHIKKERSSVSKLNSVDSSLKRNGIMKQYNQPDYRKPGSKQDRSRLLNQDGILATSSDQNAGLTVRTSHQLGDPNNLIRGQVTSPAMFTMDPITEQGFNVRKASLNLQAQKKAVALYQAPVVGQRYKRVISHFNKPKNSYHGQRLDPILAKHDIGQMDNSMNPYLAQSKEGQMTIATDEPSRKHLDLNSPTMTPNQVFSDQDIDEDKVIEKNSARNTGQVQSPNPVINEKVKVYYEKKSEQSSKYNGLMAASRSKRSSVQDGISQPVNVPRADSYKDEQNILSARTQNISNRNSAALEQLPGLSNDTTPNKKRVETKMLSDPSAKESLPDLNNHHSQQQHSQEIINL